MKIAEIRSKDIGELKTLVSDLRKERCRLGLSLATGDKMKTHRFSALRKQIARVITVIEEKKVQEHA